jgi:hypothetical protein
MRARTSASKRNQPRRLKNATPAVLTECLGSLAITCLVAGALQLMLPT